VSFFDISALISCLKYRNCGAEFPHQTSKMSNPEIACSNDFMDWFSVFSHKMWLLDLNLLPTWAYQSAFGGRREKIIWNFEALFCRNNANL